MVVGQITVELQMPNLWTTEPCMHPNTSSDGKSRYPHLLGTPDAKISHPLTTSLLLFGSAADLRATTALASLLTWQKEVLASMKIELHPPLVGGGPLVLSLPFTPLLVLCLSGIYSPPGSSLWWNNPTPRWFSYSSRETDQRFSLAHDPTWLISLSFPGGHRNYLRNARKYELTWWNSVLEFVEVKRQSEFFSTVSLRDHFHTIKCTHYTFYGIEIHNFYNHDFYNLWFLINLSN